ncbi:hypothetical protein PUN28_001689 [Cardiocondyla obscurior]|uniref:Uncharacterized protein n=1 Tax=Cardiocondyla obscurior TaxID=286306 RepID=A0AAW2GQN7_9HYME
MNRKDVPAKKIIKETDCHSLMVSGVYDEILGFKMAPTMRYKSVCLTQRESFRTNAVQLVYKEQISLITRFPQDKAFENSTAQLNEQKRLLKF